MSERVKTAFQSKKSIKILAGILIAVLVLYCGFSLVKNYADISRLNAQAAEYNAQYEQQVKDNEKIKAILDSDNKDEYIEQKAREKGYVKEGDVVFYDIS